MDPLFFFPLLDLRVRVQPVPKSGPVSHLPKSQVRSESRRVAHPVAPTGWGMKRSREVHFRGPDVRLKLKSRVRDMHI